MALKKDLNYYLTRLDYVKFLWIHMVTWVTFLILVAAVVPFYTYAAPWAAGIYTSYFIPQKNIVVPKVITAKPYEVGETKVIDLINGQKILYVAVNNKQNPDVGFSPWVYTYQILADNGDVLEQRLKDSEYLLPGEQTYVIVYTNNPRAATLRIQPNDISVLVPHNPDSPNFLQQPDITQRQATLTENTDGNSYKVYLLFKNNDRLEVERFDFIYILRNRQGVIVGISSSVLTGFRAGTEREAAILSQPKPMATQDRTPLLETITRVNYLDPNIVILR